MALQQTQSSGNFSLTSPDTLTRSATSLIPTVKTTATLVNPTSGDRKAVASGSQDAQQLFGKGYILETKAPASVGTMPGSTSGTGSTPTKSTDPVTSFNQQLMTMLNQAQKSSNPAALMGQKEQFQQSNINAGSNQPPLKVDPNTALNYQNSQSHLYDPVITNINDRMTLLNQGMSQFNSLVQTAQSIGADVQKLNPPQVLLDNLKGAYLAGASLSDDQFGMLAQHLELTPADYAAHDAAVIDVAKRTYAVTHSPSGSGGGGGGFNYPSAPSKPKQTFEEFIAEKENTAGMSFSPSEREKLRAEYDAQTATSGSSVEDLSNQFESAVLNLGSVSSQNQARKYFQSLIDSGNTQGMESYLSRMALEGLNGKTLTDYQSMGTLLSGSSTALNEINSFSSRNPGLYKTALETAKPFLNVSRDQNWVDFTSKVEAAQAGYINAIYGANLTGGELERANRFLIDFSRDNIETVNTKLQNMKELASSVQQRLLNEQRGIFGDSSKTTESKSGSSYDDYLSAIGQ